MDQSDDNIIYGSGIAGTPVGDSKQDEPANETGPPVFVLPGGCPIISVSHRISLLLFDFCKENILYNSIPV